MIIALTSQKGGVGKSTLSTNLAVSFAHQKKDVLLVDADAQASAAEWAADRTEGESHRPPVQCVRQLGRIKSNLQDLNKRYDVVIVDCAGRDSLEMRTALFAADIAIIPIRCSQPDIRTLRTMNTAVGEAREINPSLRAYILLSMVPTNPAIKEELHARMILEDFPELKALGSKICDRKVFRDAMVAGLGVLELDDVKAAAEINALLAELGLHPIDLIPSPKEEIEHHV